MLDEVDAELDWAKRGKMCRPGGKVACPGCGVTDPYRCGLRDRRWELARDRLPELSKLELFLLLRDRDDKERRR